MKILIRCDAGESPEIGTGHVVRMRHLATALSKTHGNVSFLSRTEHEFSIIKKIIGESVPIISAPNEQLEENSPAEKKTILDCAPHTIIFDRLQTSEGTVKALKNENINVVSLDDNGPGSLYTDLTINSLVPSLPTTRENIYEGYKYLITEKVVLPEGIEKKPQISLSFGGYDHKRFCKLILERLDFPRFENYKFVFLIGNQEYHDQLSDVIAKRQIKNAEVYVRPHDFYKIIAESRLAIVSGGLTLFDVIKLSVPSVALSQYDHQIYNIKKLADLGLTRYVDEQEDFSAVLDEILSSPPAEINAKGLLDNDGLRRVIELLEKKNLV